VSSPDLAIALRGAQERALMHMVLAVDLIVFEILADYKNLELDFTYG
jgi:hypothetical protein